MLDRHAESIRSRLIPQPKTFSASYNVFKLRDGCAVTLRSPDPAAKPAVLEWFARYCSCIPALTCENTVPDLPPEGYELAVDPERCTITGKMVQTVGYALKSMRQLMESERGVLSSVRKQLPCVTIQDAPALAFRAVHLCWFPETPVWQMEKLLRLAAYYKFNTAVIESWGVLAFDSHPEFCWGGKYAVQKAEFRRLIELGKSLGIRLVPQFNLFGHASCARDGTGKHVLLDRHPEYEPLFEPAGWTWCISNPATRQYLADLVLELCDLYNDPPYFHIGCDEAYTPESCSLCMHDFQRKLGEHLTYFHDLLARRGTRSMMWHDMLLCRDDPRFAGCTACGSLTAGYDTLAGRIPKTMILCDWQYRTPREGACPWPTTQVLKDLGFPVAVCPWNNAAGTASLGKFAAENQLFGLLQTVWHHGRVSHEMDTIFAGGANAAWAPGQVIPGESREQLNHHLRQLDFEMGLSDYRELGSVQFQISPYPCQGE